MEYMIIEGGSAEQLARKVSKSISSGWKPQGGVSVSMDGNVTVYSQAVIREK